MLINHSMSIAVSKFSLFYKVLLYSLIVTLIFSAIAFSSVYFIMEPIFQGIDNMNFFEHIGNAFKSIFSGNLEIQNEAFHILSQDLDRIGVIFAENEHNVIGGLCAIIGMIFLGKFLLSISYYTITDILNNFMNSNSKYGFTSNLIANLKKGVAYSFVDTLITIPYMLFVGVVIFLIGWGIGHFSVIMAISVCICVLMILLALKSAVFALWLPTYVNEDLGVFRSMQKSIVANKELIIKNLGLFVMTNFVSYCVIILAGLLTFGLGFIFASCFANIVYWSIKLVLYYRKNELKYYIDANTVIDSKHTIKSVY